MTDQKGLLLLWGRRCVGSWSAMLPVRNPRQPALDRPAARQQGSLTQCRAPPFSDWGNRLQPCSRWSKTSSLHKRAWSRRARCWPRCAGRRRAGRSSWRSRRAAPAPWSATAFLPPGGWVGVGEEGGGGGRGPLALRRQGGAGWMQKGTSASKQNRVHDCFLGLNLNAYKQVSACPLLLASHTQLFVLLGTLQQGGPGRPAAQAAAGRGGCRRLACDARPECERAGLLWGFQDGASMVIFLWTVMILGAQEVILRGPCPSHTPRRCWLSWWTSRRS